MVMIINGGEGEGTVLWWHDHSRIIFPAIDFQVRSDHVPVRQLVHSVRKASGFGIYVYSLPVSKVSRSLLDRNCSSTIVHFVKHRLTMKPSQILTSLPPSSLNPPNQPLHPRPLFSPHPLTCQLAADFVYADHRSGASNG